MAAAADVDRVPELELELGFGIFGGDRVTGCGSLYRWLGGGARNPNEFGWNLVEKCVGRSVEHFAGTDYGWKKKRERWAGAKKNKRAGLGCSRAVS